MIPSNSGSKRFHNFSQVRAALKSQDQVSSSPSLLPPQQNYENIPPFGLPRIAGESSVHQPSNFNQPLNFPEFLQHINFSVPPPFPPPVLPHPVFGAHHPCLYPNFNIPNAAPQPGILTYQCDPNENEQSNIEESVLPEEILLRCQKKDERPQLQLHNFSEKLKNFQASLAKLKGDVENLDSLSSQLDLASWSDRIASLSSQRVTLEKLKQAINVDSTSLSLLKYKMKKRLKKRKSQRKRNLIETKSLSKYEIASLHMQRLQQIVDKQKQEESFKREADAILFSVRQKKSKANGQIQFLTALSRLHSARINATNAQNKPSLSNAVCGFNRIIDKLKSMWQSQMEEYLLEENGLNIMVKDLAVTAEDLDCSKMKETCGQWLELLFGSTHLEKDSYFSNYNELIEIRRNWDKYVVNEEKNSTKIPAGWIVPKHHRDDAWSKFVS